MFQQYFAVPLFLEAVTNYWFFPVPCWDDPSTSPVRRDLEKCPRTGDVKPYLFRFSLGRWNGSAELIPTGCMITLGIPDHSWRRLSLPDMAKYSTRGYSTHHLVVKGVVCLFDLFTILLHPSLSASVCFHVHTWKNNLYTNLDAYTVYNVRTWFVQ